MACSSLLPRCCPKRAEKHQPPQLIHSMLLPLPRSFLPRSPASAVLLWCCCAVSSGGPRGCARFSCSPGEECSEFAAALLSSQRPQQRSSSSERGLPHTKREGVRCSASLQPEAGERDYKQSTTHTAGAPSRMSFLSQFSNSRVCYFYDSQFAPAAAARSSTRPAERMTNEQADSSLLTHALMLCAWLSLSCVAVQATWVRITTARVTR